MKIPRNFFLSLQNKTTDGTRIYENSDAFFRNVTQHNISEYRFLPVSMVQLRNGNLELDPIQDRDRIAPIQL